MAVAVQDHILDQSPLSGSRAVGCHGGPVHADHVTKSSGPMWVATIISYQVNKSNKGSTVELTAKTKNTGADPAVHGFPRTFGAVLSIALELSLQADTWPGFCVQPVEQDVGRAIRVSDVLCMTCRGLVALVGQPNGISKPVKKQRAATREDCVEQMALWEDAAVAIKVATNEVGKQAWGYAWEEHVAGFAGRHSKHHGILNNLSSPNLEGVPATMMMGDLMPRLHQGTHLFQKGVVNRGQAKVVATFVLAYASVCEQQAEHPSHFRRPMLEEAHIDWFDVCHETPRSGIILRPLSHRLEEMSTWLPA